MKFGIRQRDTGRHVDPNHAGERACIPVAVAFGSAATMEHTAIPRGYRSAR